MALDVAKGALVLFFVSIVQVAILNPASIAGATPDLLLITLVALALLRGSIFGAAGGFFAGLLVDTATLQTLGLTSLLLTVAGYWIGRYGETTGRDRSHAPLLSVAVVTVLYAFGALLIRSVLGQGASLELVVDSLLQTVVLNLLISVPVFALCRALFRPAEIADRAGEVRLLG